jgi:hypothetical protein
VRPVEPRYAERVTTTDPTTILVADDEVMDFSSGRKIIRFRIDDDVFEAAGTIAAELALDYADKSEQLEQGSATKQQQKEVLHALLRLILLPRSADRFIARLSDVEAPISNDQVIRVTQWLFEEYGLRPTLSDSASLTGSESQDAGTSSTVST